MRNIFSILQHNIFAQLCYVVYLPIDGSVVLAPKGTFFLRVEPREKALERGRKKGQGAFFVRLPFLHIHGRAEATATTIMQTFTKKVDEQKRGGGGAMMT